MALFQNKPMNKCKNVHFLLIPTLLTGRDLEKDKKFCHDCGNKGSQFIPSMN